VSPRRWAIATAVFGLLVLTTFAVFALLPQMAAAQSCLPPGSVVQFELARNAADLLALFGAPGSECRVLAVAAMDAVNTVDVWAFIPLYTLFCAAGALYLAEGALLRPLTVAAVGAALLAAAADYLETTTLLAITSTLDDAEPLLAYSQFGAWAKFTLLAAHALFCAGLCYMSPQRRTVLGVLLILPTFGVLAAAYDHAALASVMNGAFALAWLGLLLVALRDAVRAKGSPAAVQSQR
jgi:hypothetical protein